MVQSSVLRDVVKRTNRAALGVAGTKHQGLQARIHNRAGAHGARFKRDGKSAIMQSPATLFGAGQTQRNKFRMSSRIIGRLAVIGRL